MATTAYGSADDEVMVAEPRRLTELRHTVDRELAARLAAVPGRLRATHPRLGPFADELVAYVGNGGKRLRPALLLLGHEAAGGEPDDVLGPALALELLHTCALVHDDIIDQAPTRRGQATPHDRFAGEHRAGGWHGDGAAFGVAAAILLGDLAFVIADELFITAAVPADRLLAGMGVFTRLREEVTAGQYLDVLAAAARATERETALAVATLKSGRYSVARPLELGAVLAGADEQLLAALRAFGDPLGRAFQLRDDLLGVFGDEATTGKSTASDLAEGKRTLLVAEAAARLEGDEREWFFAHLGDPAITPADVERLRGMLDSSGARDAVETHLQGELREATVALDALSGVGAPAAVVAVLRELASYLVTRAA